MPNLQTDTSAIYKAPQNTGGFGNMSIMDLLGRAMRARELQSQQAASSAINSNTDPSTGALDPAAAASYGVSPSANPQTVTSMVQAAQASIHARAENAGLVANALLGVLG